MSIGQLLEQQEKEVKFGQEEIGKLIRKYMKDYDPRLDQDYCSECMRYKRRGVILCDSCMDK